MATILLVNFDQEFQDGLALSLQYRRHKVYTTRVKAVLGFRLTEELAHVNEVIFNVSRMSPEYWDILRSICRSRNRAGQPVSVLCYSAGYQGVQFERRMEKLGARVAYAR